MIQTFSHSKHNVVDVHGLDTSTLQVLYKDDWTILVEVIYR